MNNLISILKDFDHIAICTFTNIFIVTCTISIIVNYDCYEMKVFDLLITMMDTTLDSDA